MTSVYLVRHAEPDFAIHEDAIRPLNEKGLVDCVLVTEFLKDKEISAVFSSPFKRAYDTITPFADEAGLAIEVINDFRERAVSSEWVEDFTSYSKKQWEDFSYKLQDGESLAETQQRGITSLQKLLLSNKGKSIAIATHGTLISVILDYYDNTFGYAGFCEMKKLMPWIAAMHFDEKKLVSVEKINLFVNS